MAKFCVNGHEVDDQMNYCPQCGAEIVENKEQNKFCVKCGHERIGTEKYCSQCGTPYEENHSFVISNKITTRWIKKIPRSLLIGLLSVVLIGGGLYYWFCIRTDYSLDGLAKTLMENEFSEVGTFSDGLAMVCNDDNKIGYIDNKGNIVAPCIYNKYEDGSYDEVSEGLICVHKEGKFGFIDKNGKEVIPCKYDWAISFSEELAPVKKDGLWGFIDRTGKEVIPFKYNKAYAFSEGLAAVQKDEKWGFVDKAGRVVIPCKCDDAFSFSEGLARVYMDGKCDFIDKTGKGIVSGVYEWADYSFSDGLAIVQKDGKRGFIDKTGKEVIPCRYDMSKYDMVKPFSEGLAAVQKDGKWGFIDKTGKESIPYKYKWCDNFSEGMAAFSDDKEFFGFIDKNGREVIPCLYEMETVSHFIDYVTEDQYGFSNGFVKVVKDRLYGIINKKGEEVIPLGKYEELTGFSEGLAWVKKDGLWGVVNTKGESTFDHLSESQLIAMREKHKRAEEERIAREEEERRRWEEENKPSNVFYRLAQNGDHVWSFNWCTQEPNYLRYHHNTFFFYPTSSTSGNLSYIESYENSNDRGHIWYSYCTAFYSIEEDKLLRATLIQAPTNRTGTNHLRAGQSIVLEIVKYGDEIVLKEVDGIWNRNYKQMPSSIFKDYARK